MQEQNFEKQVREKMDDLSFVPSAPVWEKVEEQIKKKKEKRRLIFWLLPLMIATGLGWWLIAENGLSRWNEPLQATKLKEVNQQPLSNPGIAIQVPARPANINNNSNRGEQTEHFTESKIGNLQNTKTSRESKKPLIHQKAKAPDIIDLSLPNEITNNGSGLDERDARPVIYPVNFEFNADSIANARSLNERAIHVQVKDKSKEAKTLNQSKWQFLYSAQVGISGISEGFGNIGSAEIYFDASPSMSAGGNTGNTPILPPSTLKAGVGFSTGFDVKRKINNRLAVVSGLHYAYYSNTIEVGSLIYRDTTISRTNASVLQTLAFYRNDENKQDYTNQYHFIQLPISAEYKVVKSLPLYIQAGIKLEQLLSSNALFYNKYAGVYVEDKEMLAKTGVHLFTGFSYLFRSQKAFSFAVGPQFQYGITNLSKNKNNNQHLYFAGISTQFFLKK
ncbi:PorT family protein [Chitinophagaceae bacterium LB-8]|uniref:PorT family protein n=1 Tax=Paraflavisolibacter caeni TaxID=2982496 RepID=A0A9X2Y2D0_9BACT|nr:outer membrane beta-barrel protein [Paraflavisolibacter caeni]MCU7552453.1 PorT family protein [Paraflavisolibacter caeni]